MTKIKVDIESDQDIVAAKILLKHANGKTEIDDIDLEESMSDKLNKQVKKQTVRESGIDDAFKETY